MLITVKDNSTNQVHKVAAWIELPLGGYEFITICGIEATTGGAGVYIKPEFGEQLTCDECKQFMR